MGGLILKKCPIRTKIKEELKKIGIEVPIKIIDGAPLRTILWDPDEEEILKLNGKVPKKLAEEIISKTSWAQGWAKGIATKLLHLKPSTPEYQKYVEILSKEAAKRVLD